MANVIVWDGVQLPELDECDCSCHHDEGTTHIMPCCRICSRCKRRVRAGWWENHPANCPARHDTHSEPGA